MTEDRINRVSGASISVQMSSQGPPEDEWFDYLEKVGCREPSLTPGYYKALCVQYESTGIKPQVVIARRANRISTLAICLTGKSSIQFELGERTLFSIPQKTVTIHSAACSATDVDSARAVLQALILIPHQLVIVQPLAAFGPDGNILNTEGMNHTAYMPDGFQESCSLVVNGTWGRYLQRLPRKVRHELHRKINRLNRKYGEMEISLERFESPAEAERYHDIMGRIDTHSWQHKRIRNRSLDLPNSKKYFMALAQHGLFRGYVLSIRDIPAAFAFGVLYRACFHIKEIGYSIEQKADSPGQLLLYFIFRSLFEKQEVARCSLGYGKERFKKEFCNRFDRAIILWLYRKRSLAALIVAMHRIWMDLRRLAASICNTVGMKQPLLTWLRQN